MRKRKLLAVSVSDLHLSERPPLARSREEDWFGTMRGYLDQVKKMAGSVPIIVPGDVFDRWDVSPAIINFALEHLPQVYAIPGNHDLPNHRYADIERSAYWTLVYNGKICNIPPGQPVITDSPPGDPLVLHGFPCGHPVTPLKKPDPERLNIAVVHDYLWTEGHGYEGAPGAKELPSRAESFQGYDIALVGDNHDFFTARAGGCRVINVGTMMRRKSDERRYSPRVGLVYSDGSVGAHPLDCTADKFLEAEEVLSLLDGIGAQTLIEELNSLADCGVSFADAVGRLLEREKVSPRAKSLILRAMEPRR